MQDIFKLILIGILVQLAQEIGFNNSARKCVQLLPGNCPVGFIENQFRLNSVERENYFRVCFFKCKWNLKLYIGTFYPSGIL